LRSQSQR